MYPRGNVLEVIVAKLSSNCQCFSVVNSIDNRGRLQLRTKDLTVVSDVCLVFGVGVGKVNQAVIASDEK